MDTMTLGQFLETFETEERNTSIRALAMVMSDKIEAPIDEEILELLIYLRDALRAVVKDPTVHNSGLRIHQLNTYERVVKALEERLMPRTLKIEYIVATDPSGEEVQLLGRKIIAALMQQGVSMPMVSIEESTDPKESLLKVTVVHNAQNSLTESDLFALVEVVCEECDVKEGANIYN